MMHDSTHDVKPTIKKDHEQEQNRRIISILHISYCSAKMIAGTEAEKITKPSNQTKPNQVRLYSLKKQDRQIERRIEGWKISLIVLGKPMDRLMIAK
jgi:hypothetical protein